MNENYQILEEFITAAIKERKYPRNTAAGYRSALKLIEPSLTDEEKTSIDTFKNHIDPIFQSVFSNSKGKITASSLETYKRRIKSLLYDYENYGQDQSKMANWNRPTKQRRIDQDQSETKKPESSSADSNIISNEPISQELSAMSKFEIVIRKPNVRAILLIPADLKKQEAEKIKTFIDASVTEK